MLTLQVFGAIVRIRDDVADPPCPGALYVLRHPQILSRLFEGCVARVAWHGMSRGGGSMDSWSAPLAS